MRVTTVRVPYGGLQPQATLAGGVLHLLYYSGDPASGDLFYVRSTDLGATFSPPVRVNSQPGSALALGTIRGGQLAIGREGRAHVVWNGSDNALPRGLPSIGGGRPGAPLLYSRSSPDGRTFEPQRNLMRRSTTLDGGGSIAAGPDGPVLAVWHGNAADDGDGNETTRRVWIARSYDDGAVFSDEEPAWTEPTGACGCCGLQALATPGGLHLLYRSAVELTSRDVYHVFVPAADPSRPHGSRVHAWRIGACPLTSMSLSASGSRVVGSWETDGQVFFEDLDEGTARTPAVVRAPGDAAGRKHPRVVAGPDGETLLVWTEKTGWARGGALAWQVFDRTGTPSGAHGTLPGIPAWSFAAAVARPMGGYLIIY
jgi:hypothetical protein